MLGGFKSIFFLMLSISCANSVLAQFTDDIPLFSDEDVYNDSSLDSKKETPVSENTETQSVAPALENSINSKKIEPNIGRKAIPLDKIVLTPDPLPEVSIDLSGDKSVSNTPQKPQQPVNTRQESIDISIGGKAKVNSPQSSSFDNYHEVRQFDLSGFYLGMTPQSVLQMAKQKRYQISKIKKAIPLFQTTYYETRCRESGIRAPEMIRSCIRQYAKKNRQDYVEEILLSKKAAHESIHFKFTSPATGNEVYQITYQNYGDNSLNFTRQNLAKKQNRKEAFFNAVFALYGYPDDSKELVWGDKNDAYMQVSMYASSYDAMIKLVDMKLSNEDYFAAEDWKSDQESPYHFGFAD